MCPLEEPITMNKIGRLESEKPQELQFSIEAKQNNGTDESEFLD